MLKKLIVLLALVVGTASASELNFDNGPLQVRLLPSACTLTNFPGASTFHKAVVVFDKKTIAACWKLDALGLVRIVDEEGDTGLLPLSAFKVNPGV